MNTEYWFGGYRVYNVGDENQVERLADWHIVPYPFERISQKSFIRWVESGDCARTFAELNPGICLFSEAFRPGNKPYTLLVTISVDDINEVVRVSVSQKHDGSTYIAGTITRCYGINTCMNLLTQICGEGTPEEKYNRAKEYLSTSMLVSIERDLDPIPPEAAEKDRRY
jgi:hypothetical protein